MGGTKKWTLLGSNSKIKKKYFHGTCDEQYDNIYENIISYILRPAV